MNITIVIPTHNRHEKLERNIRYLESKNVNVIVIDSTEKKFDASGFKRVKYIHNPSFKFSDKIIHACEIALTDYICLCADDDFVLVDKLERFVAETPEGCSSIIGSTVLFDEKFSGDFRFQRKITNSGFFDKERIKNFFSDYSQVLWGIYRVASLRQAFLDIKSLSFLNDNFIELYLSYALITSGGVYRTSGFFSIREVSPSDHWGKRHKNLRQAYLEDIEYTLIDFSKISVLLGGERFSLAFSAYLGDIDKRPSSFIRVVRKLAKVFKRVISINAERKLSSVEIQELDEIACMLSKYQS